MLRLSPNQIQTWMRCRMAWKWRYIDQLELVAPKPKALKVGDIIHRILEKINRQSGEEKEVINDLFAYVYSIYPDEDAPVVTAEVEHLIIPFLNEIESGLPYSIVTSELTLEMPLPEYDVLLTGRVDALANDRDGGLWRLEYKTAIRRDSAFLSGLRHSIQDACHTLLLKHHMPNIQGTIYQLLIKTQVPTFPWTMNRTSGRRLHMIRQTIEGVARDIRREEFYPSCDCYDYGRECEYKKLCENDSPATRQAFYRPITNHR